MNTKKTIQFSPDADTSAGATEETKPVAGGMDWDTVTVEASPAEPEKIKDTSVPDGKKPPAGTPINSQSKKEQAAAAPNEPADTTKKVSDETIKAEKTPVEAAAGDENELTLPDPEDITDTPEDAPAENTWIETAKEIGIDGVDADDFEVFKKGVEAKIEKVRTEAQQIALDKYPVEAQNLIKFLASGKTMEDYINPLKEYDKVLSLDDKALITASLEGTGEYTADEIEEEIKLIEEKGELASSAKRLRAAVKMNKKQAGEQIIDQGVQTYESQQARIENERKKEDTLFKSALSTLDKVYDVKINDKHKAAIQKKWDSGYYRNRFKNDPNFVADLIVKAELGEAAINERLTKTFDGGRNIARNELHNTKMPAGNQSGKRILGTERGANTEPLSDWGDFVKNPSGQGEE
jgi:hypothetical protein